MKVLIFENNVDAGHKESGWYLVADSAVSNTGKPFYLPDFYGKTEAHLAIAVKIIRLGKSVKRKFASKYYSEMAPALHFTLPELAERFKTRSLPEDASRSFDRSLMVGEFSEIIPGETFSLWLNGEEKTTLRLEDLQKSIDVLLEEFSVINTVKMGDLLVPGLQRGIEIKEGDLLEVKKDGQPAFRVRVK